MSKTIEIYDCRNCEHCSGDGYTCCYSYEDKGRVDLEARWMMLDDCPLPDSTPLTIPATGPVTGNDILEIIAENERGEQGKPGYKYADENEYFNYNGRHVSPQCEAFIEGFNAARERK